jgi:signal peptidase I
MPEAHNLAPEVAPLAITPRPSIPAPRRAAEVGVLAVCLLLILRHWGVEPYAVPTGSMAPALAGHHRTRLCPRCGYPVHVGRRPADKGPGDAPYRLYRGAYCLNCGLTGLDMHAAAHARGDQLLVNRSVFAFRAPRRWEMVVFRLFGITFVKRVIGLPGELVELCDGDVFINDELERKTLAQARALCIPVFDNDFQPEPGGWRERWEVAADHSGPHPLAGTELHLDSEGSAGRYHLVTYRHYQLDTKQCEPVRDEYGYNGGERPPALVHDFLMECSLEVGRGEGAVLLAITDGKDRLVAELPVGRDAEARLSRVNAWPPQTAKDPWPGDAVQLRAARGVHLLPGKPYRVELAFVDRRVTLALDGRTVLGSVDLPAVSGRPGVVRPVVLGVRGVRLVVRNFRLARDIHYTSAGRNGGPGKAVRLGSDQYFVLGDNSPNSQDSRFWPDGGAVPAGSLLGKPFVVHLPGRVTGGDAGTRAVRGIDWGRVRWLR